MLTFRIARPALLLVLGLGCALLPSKPDVSPWPSHEEIQLSVLALGDTGRRPSFGPYFNRQRTVAKGLEAEHRRHPADALVFLGDNFYWDGLEREELVLRVRQNVAGPYCRFVDADAPRREEIDRACRIDEDERHPVPMYAVLGNHDHNHPESPALQREELPLFVPNWHVPSGPAQAIDLPGGLSLVLADSTVLGQETAARDDEAKETAAEEALLQAMQRSRGPWRVLVTHHPVAWARDPEGSPHPYRQMIRRVIERSGVEVHLALSGHEHNLQVIEMAPPGPPLQVVAGSGSKVRELKTSNPAVRFARAEPGFARLDLVGRGPEQRLVVSLFATRHWPPLPAGSPRLLARFAISSDGGVQDVLAAPPASAIPLAASPHAHP
jgi:3',5'-cyclic AMP phosphodiesterase CpdA